MPPKKRPRRSTGSTGGVANKSAAGSAAASGSSSTAALVHKKRVVEKAKDVDEVLRKCRKLREDLRKAMNRKQKAKKIIRQKDDDDDDDSDNSDNNENMLLSLLSSSDNTSEEEDSDFDGDEKKKATDGDTPTSSKKKKATDNKKKKLTIKDIIEVSELNADEVLDGIENVTMEVLEQILQQQPPPQQPPNNKSGGAITTTTAAAAAGGGGFVLKIPSRTSANQIYIKEWDRIVLGSEKKISRSFLNVKECRKSTITLRVLSLLYQILVKKIHITKRDLFYTDVKLFRDQNDSDNVLDDIACLLSCTRSNLHVVASDKGLIVGNIQFYEDGDFIDCTKMGVSGKAIPPYIDKIENITSTAEFILLVEKEAAYMRLAEDRFYSKYPCIIITAKGQPDVASRMFLSRLNRELSIPVLGFVDSDPYGLKILSVYMSGSKNMSYDSSSLTCPNIQWLGLRPSDLNKYNLPEQCRLDMTENDIKTGKELLKEDFIQKNEQWMKEIRIMVQTKKKAEIQALSSFGFQYVTEEYLPRKLREGDWI